MLFTGKGDNGKTGTFGTKEKLSKSSSITEALGSLDEANSYIGVCKATLRGKDLHIQNIKLLDIIDKAQNNLFIIQAQVAGADKKILDGEVKLLEEVIGNIEKELPPIKSFLIPGANEISAHCDFARTLVRRAERRIVSVSEEYPEKIDPYTLAYLTGSPVCSMRSRASPHLSRETARTPPTY